MKLMTKELLAAFAETGSQEEELNPVVIAKFFNPYGRGTWLATEFDPENNLFFGYVSLFGDHNDEWGYFSLDELQSLEILPGLGIERDLYFKPRPFNRVWDVDKHQQIY